MVPREIISADTEKSNGPNIRYVDSGVLFHTLNIPLDVSEIAYRLIIDGLWTIDPHNPAKQIDLQSGLEYSVVAVPKIKRDDQFQTNDSGRITFTFNGPPGETVTVAGSFNSWDPFMYQLREAAPGAYSLTLSLPPGQYHYVFYHRGQRILDPVNNQKMYTREGLAASEILVN